MVPIHLPRKRPSSSHREPVQTVTDIHARHGADTVAVMQRHQHRAHGGEQCQRLEGDQGQRCIDTGLRGQRDGPWPQVCIRVHVQCHGEVAIDGDHGNVGVGPQPRRYGPSRQPHRPPGIPRSLHRNGAWAASHLGREVRSFAVITAHPRGHRGIGEQGMTQPPLQLTEAFHPGHHRRVKAHTHVKTEVPTVDVAQTDAADGVVA